MAPSNIPTTDYVDGKTASDVVNTDSTPVIGAQGANIRTYVDHITISNGHATVGTRVDILDDTTVRFTTFALAAGGGGSFTFPTALRGTANKSWNVQCGTTGAQVRCSLGGYKVREA